MNYGKLESLFFIGFEQLKMPGPHIQIHQCLFKAEITQLKTEIKMPSTFLLEWKSSTNQTISKLQIENNQFQECIEINESLQCFTYLQYNTHYKKYSAKEASLCLSTVTNDHKNSVKLVGRIIINLADVLNGNAFSQQESLRLEYRTNSRANLTFSIKKIFSRPSSVQSSDFDESFFSGNVMNSQFLSEKTQALKENPQEVKINQIDLSSSEENKRLRKMNEDLKNQINDYENEKEKLERQIRELNKKIKEIESEIVEELQEKIREQTEEGIKKSQRITQIEAELQKSESLRLDFEQEVLELKYELSELKTQLHVKNKDEKSTESETHPKISELAALLKSVEEEKEEYFEELKLMKKQNFQLKEEKKQIQDKLMKPQDDKIAAELSEKIIFLQSEFESLKQKLDILDAENANLLEETRKLQQQNQNFYENEFKFESWQSEREDLVHSNELLMEEKIKLENLNQKFKMSLQKRESDVRSLWEKLNLMEEDKKKVEEENFKFKDQNKKLESQIKYTKQSREQFDRETKQIQNQVVELNKVRVELSSKNTQLENQLKNSQSKYQKMQRQLKLKTEVVKEKNKFLDNLSHQIEVQVEKNNKMEAKITMLADQETIMRETLMIIEEESNKILAAILEKDKKEVGYIDQINRYVGQIRAIQFDLTEFKEKYRNLIIENETLKQENYELKQKDYLENDSKNDNESSSISAHALQEQRIKQISKQLKQKVAEFTKEIQRLEENNRNLEKKIQKVEENQIKHLENEKNSLQNKNNEIFESQRKLQFLIIKKDEKIEELLTIMKQNDAKFEQALKTKIIENQKIEKKLKEMEKEESKYEQRIREQKDLVNETLKKLERSEFDRTESSDKIRFNKKGDIKKSQIISACESINEIALDRRKQGESETIIELLLGKNLAMEEKFQRITIQRGIIQEQARKLSVQFAKIKSYILKGKGMSQEKKELIGCLKPSQQKIKELIEIGESLSKFQLEMVEEIEA